ncbi:hypothetical protein BSKO_00985 [Bryopsis sp. KO-2023]|nr:hypothetical protein BSKO_00985 [Bryopsis sp. KO-2023]
MDRNMDSKSDRLLRYRRRTIWIVNLTKVFEAVDESILPAMYKYVARDFKATPKEIAAVTMYRGLTQCLTCPIGGVAGHVFDRIRVLFVGCLLWATMTFLFGLSKWAPHPLLIGSLIWAANGFGLTLVVPNTEGITADYYPKNSRGAAFGLLYLTGGVGALIGSLYATNIAGVDFGGVEGWQVGMFILAAIGLSIGVADILVAKDPRRLLPEKESQDSGKVSVAKNACMDTMDAIKRVITIPSFIVLVLQGCVGNMPWSAFSAFVTLYLQLIGMSNLSTSILTALFHLGTSLGSFLSGYIGDEAAKRFPDHGRIFVCQFSVFSGIPLSVVIFSLLPKNGESSTFWLHLFFLFFEGLLISWAGPSCCRPIFAEVVPANMRSMVYSFDRFFESFFASGAGFFVGWAASAWFGYTGEATTSGDPSIDLPRAEALGKAIMVFSVVPWMICLISFVALHFTYPRDRIPEQYEQLEAELLNED